MAATAGTRGGGGAAARGSKGGKQLELEGENGEDVEDSPQELEENPQQLEGKADASASPR